LAQLQAVAGFFRRTEPHSPVAYLVERAVRWASMPLEDWLSDVIGGETALYTIKSQLGIRDPEESS
jgi:type VI secretion system protein ImpA